MLISLECHSHESKTVTGIQDEYNPKKVGEYICMLSVGTKP